MATEPEIQLGLNEAELRGLLTEELDRALQAQGGKWSADVVAHSVARIIHLDHLRAIEQLEAAGLRLQSEREQAKG